MAADCLATKNGDNSPVVQVNFGDFQVDNFPDDPLEIIKLLKTELQARDDKITTLTEEVIRLKEGSSRLKSYFKTTEEEHRTRTRVIDTLRYR